MKSLICKSKRLLVSAFALAFVVCAAFGQQSEPQARKFAEFSFDADAESSRFYFEDEYFARRYDELRENYQQILSNI